MSAANFAAALPFAILVACLFRARLLALAVVPPCALIFARFLELVDIESASHPLRWVVPVVCAGLAALALAWASIWNVHEGRWRMQDPRATIASLLVLGSCAPDLLALHPFFWARFAEWPLVPVQIAVCLTILVVLLAPERWIAKCLR